MASVLISLRKVIRKAATGLAKLSNRLDKETILLYLETPIMGKVADAWAGVQKLLVQKDKTITDLNTQVSTLSNKVGDLQTQVAIIPSLQTQIGVLTTQVAALEAAALDPADLTAIAEMTLITGS